MKNKKSQSTIEFLMTYGWAFLVVLMAIGILTYLGLFDGAFISKKPTNETFSICDIHCKSLNKKCDYKNTNMSTKNGNVFYCTEIKSNETKINNCAFIDNCFYVVEE